MFTINLDRLNWKNSENIIVNNTDTSAIVEDVSDGLTYYADKYIITKFSIKTGNIVTYNDMKYLIISQIDRNKGINRARIRECNYSINFNFEGNIERVSSIINSVSFDIETNTIFSFETGKIILYINTDTFVDTGQRFIIMGSAWKVVGVDRTKQGLLILHCEKDLFGSTDDKENEIADRWKYEEQVTYTLEVEQGSIINLSEGDSLQLNIVAKRNNEVVENPELVFIVDNTDVCTIQENGLITAITEGETNIIILYKGIEVVVKVIIEEMEDSFTYTLSGSSQLRLNQTLTYTATKYNNDIPVNTTFTFSIDPLGNSNSIASIESTTNNTARVKGSSDFGDIGKYFKLIALEDGVEVAKMTIQVLGLF